MAEYSDKIRIDLKIHIIPREWLRDPEIRLKSQIFASQSVSLTIDELQRKKKKKKKRIRNSSPELAT